MPVSAPPSNPVDQLQWLVDRAAIGDLLIDFARVAYTTLLDATSRGRIPDR